MAVGNLRGMPGTSPNARQTDEEVKLDTEGATHHGT